MHLEHGVESRTLNIGMGDTDRRVCPWLADVHRNKESEHGVEHAVGCARQAGVCVLG